MTKKDQMLIDQIMTKPVAAAPVERPAKAPQKTAPSREGKVSVKMWITQDEHDMLMMLKIRKKKALEKMMKEGINKLLIEWGEGTISED